MLLIEVSNEKGFQHVHSWLETWRILLIEVSEASSWLQMIMDNLLQWWLVYKFKRSNRRSKSYSQNSTKRKQTESNRTQRTGKNKTYVEDFSPIHQPEREIREVAQSLSFFFPVTLFCLFENVPE